MAFGGALRQGGFANSTRRAHDKPCRIYVPVYSRVGMIHRAYLSAARGCRPPDRTGKKLRVRAWRRSPGRRASSQRLEGRGPSPWRPKPRLRMKFQASGPPAVLPHSRKKLRSRIGDTVRHSVEKSCPALSSELGLILLTAPAQVVCGSVGSPNVMVGDRLELDACDLELVCTLYLVPSTFEVSA